MDFRGCVHVLDRKFGTSGVHPSVVFTFLENTHKHKLGQLCSVSAEVRSPLRAF